MAIWLRRTVIAAAAAIAIADAVAQMAALRAAGLNGTAPSGCCGVQDADLDAYEQLGVADRHRRRPGAGPDRRTDDRRLAACARSPVPGDRGDHADPDRDPGVLA